MIRPLVFEEPLPRVGSLLWLDAARALMVVIFLFSGLVDAPRSVIGTPFSGLAVLTVAYLCASSLLLIALPAASKGLFTQCLPLCGFLAWAAISLAWTSSISSGLQNISAVANLVVMMIIGHAIGSLHPRSTRLLYSLIKWSAAIAAAGYALAVFFDNSGSDTLLSPRSFGLFALLGLAYNLALWRSGSNWGLWASIAITLAIAASESRLALGIAVALFPLAQIPARRLTSVVKMIAIATSALLCAYAAFIYVEPLRERFLSGDLSLTIAGITINASGRTAFWRATASSILEAPFIGQGAGSAEALIESLFTEIRHPHGDYLRIAHDYGAVGSLLWIGGVGLILKRLFQSWRAADRVFPGYARLQLTALLTVIAFVLMMTMDNAMVYVFITAPVGLIAGVAIGSGVPQTQKRMGYFR